MSRRPSMSRIRHSLPLLSLLVLLVVVRYVASPIDTSCPSDNRIPWIVPQSGMMPDGAYPAIALAPFHFVGNVTLRAAITPVRSSTPTISYIPASVKLNSSLPGLPLYPVGINTTLATPLGLYTITVFGVSGSLSHSANATFGVTSGSVPSNGAELVYFANVTRAAFAGNSTVLNNVFVDLGYVPIGIRNLSVSTTFGTYRDVGALIISLNPYDEKTTSLTIQIPPNTSPGNYSVTVTIGWVLQPGTVFETSAPDLVVHGSIIVYSNPSRLPGPTDRPSFKGLAWLLPAVFGGLAASAVVMFALLSLIERRRHASFAKPSISLGTVQPAAATRTCARCGTTVIGGRFCPKCGSQLA